MRKDHILKYLENVSKAGTESAKKELLSNLLLRLFDNDPQASEIINKISLGAERTVFNIQLKNRIKTGSADTQYDTVIIEFEKDLKKTGEHAKEQLAEYLVGNWNSGTDYNFTLIASDCITWKIYAPQYEFLIGKKRLKPEDIQLKETDSFVLNERNVDDFYFFLDRYLFRESQIKATLENIQNDFGDTSATFLSCIRIMREHFDTVKEKGEVKVAYEEWNKFLSIAYGSFEGSQDVFLVHTYLSIFAKMLAYAVITHDDYIDEEEMKGIIKGDIFSKYNIQNFVDDDFYHWVALNNNFNALKPIFRKISSQIGRYDFKDVNEDILKGVYQELIDLETRHNLGEYYTPDWLCEKIVDRCDFKKDSFILDPSCGSGSFLRAAIDRIKKKFPDLEAEKIADQINGIDIHPLSVQIAKTTVLLSLGTKIRKSKKPIQLKIFLANTLFAPDGTIGLFGSEYNLAIDKSLYSVSTKVFDDSKLFDEVVTICDDLAEATKNSVKDSYDTFEKYVFRHYNGLDPEIIGSFYKIYLGIKEAKENDRDSIWKFILQNSYKPFFLRQKYDFVIGNPPWFTFADIKNEDYQIRLRELANKYNLVPDSIANLPHLEIAAIFLSHSAFYFLRENGEISFVLPRSFLTADHHDNTRSGRAKGFAMNQIWDLKGVSPLFRIPSCVIIADKSIKSNNKIAAKGISGLEVIGKFKYANSTLKEIEDKISFDSVLWYYSKLKSRSALTNAKIKDTQRSNYYFKYFRQGATIVPRNCYFIEVTQDFDGDINNRYLTVKTSEESIKEAKPPWKKVKLDGKVHSSFIFYTAIAKNIIPFGLINPPFVILPIKIDKDKRIRLLNWNLIKEEGYLETANWFKLVEENWNKYKTEKNKTITSEDYLNWQNKLTEQNLTKPYLVIYTASAKDANATVIKRKDFNLEFIVESKAYVFYTDNLKEAYFLCAYLNSSIPNQLIKEFQTMGLFGPRDVHKKILEVPFPEFDPKDKKHIDLSELGEKCSKISAQFIKDNISLEKYNVGRIRLNVKKTIDKELKEIDKLVKILVG